jgi:hypothetical protein
MTEKEYYTNKIIYKSFSMFKIMENDPLIKNLYSDMLKSEYRHKIKKEAMYEYNTECINRLLGLE